MSGVSLLVLTTCLLLETLGLDAVAVGDQTGVTLSRRSAATVLRRQRRYNSGHLEEIHKDNLERECIEERCNMEEAREVFENNEKTMEFWASYIDGDQCKPESPCQNGGLCKDGINAYFCFCKTDFSGKNCEIEIAKQCSVNNGGCAHFCVMHSARTVCQCAMGYKLEADKKSCKATEPFPCGSISPSIIRAKMAGRMLAADPDLNGTVSYEDYDLSAYTEDAADFSSNRSQPLPLPSANLTTATPSDAGPPEGGAANVSTAATGDGGGAGEEEEEEVGGLPHWAFYPTTASITAEENQDQRIVGGNEATPGEIPWQVSLMSNTGMPFCGGSLLSDVWVITAAHCLTELNLAMTDYVVRVGEHDLNRDEGSERDHAVAEQVLHPHHDPRRSKLNHDIALLRLAAAVELSERRHAVCFGPKEFTEALLTRAPSSQVSGWGRLKHRGLAARRLQKLEVPYVDRSACKSSSRDHITRFMFCAGYLAAQMDSCQGDSGGPHVTDHGGTWFLTGIVSWGDDCAKVGKYGVYTRVSRYYTWIANTTGIR